MLKNIAIFVCSFLLFFVLTPSVVITAFPKKMSKYVVAVVHAIIFAVILTMGMYLANTRLKEQLSNYGATSICYTSVNGSQICPNTPSSVTPSSVTPSSVTPSSVTPSSVTPSKVSSMKITSPTPMSSSPQYIGCYKDSTTGMNRALPNSNPNKVTSIIDCQNIALSNNSSIFGLQDGGQCWYGSSLNSAQQYGPTSGCAELGGFNTNQLYYTKQQSPSPSPTSVVSSPTSVVPSTSKSKQTQGQNIYSMMGPLSNFPQIRW